MDDDWSFSVEELESLEANAKRSLAERRGSSSLASSASSPAKGRTLPPSIYSSPPKTSSSPSKIPRRALPVRLFKDKPGRIGLETQYNPMLVAALKTVPGHEWDQTRRIWTYPEDKLEDVWSTVSSLPTVATTIEAVPPLVLPNILQTGSQRSFEVQHRSDFSVTHSSPRQSFLQNKSPKGKHPLAITVQLYLMNSDLIAARNPYHESIKEACQAVSGRAWNTEERVWTFPKTSLEELLQALRRIPSPPIVIESVPPLAVPECGNHMENDSLGCSQPERGSSRPPRVSLWPSSGKQTDNQDAKTGHQGPQKSAVTFSVKLIFHSSGNVAAKCDYEPRLVPVLKSITKAEWRARERLWVFPFSSLQEAERKLSNIDDLTINVEHLEPLVRRALEAAANLPDLRDKYDTMPLELERRLLPFQRDGVRFALQHGGRSLIADEMGLGKTLQAIAIATCLKEAWPVLIIAPSALRLHWAAMISQWLGVPPDEIVVVMSQCFGSNREGFRIVQSTGKRPVRLDGLFNILSYELVSKLQDEIIQDDFQIIIADEAHYMKNAQAKRTAACVPLLQRSKYSILLTGTPALSRPIELFKQLEALQPGVYKNVHEYGKRYCMGGHFGVYQGASNCEELHALVKSTVMIRRLKKEVLSELPLKRRQQIYLSLDEKGMRQMRALFHELEAVKSEIKSAKSQEDAEKLKNAERQLISKIYTESAEVKISAVQDYLSTVIEADCKFLVFAHHKTMLDGIEQFFMKKKVGYIRIDGSTEASSRQTLVKRFQENENVTAALLGIRAAGVGLNLTAASTVIFAEMSWTPGDLVQAEDRVHRIGQISSVNVYYLHAHDTVDDLIWESVQHKLENVGQVLDGKEDTLHVAATGRHQSLPSGQCTLKSFLRPCTNVSVVSSMGDNADRGSDINKKRNYSVLSEDIDDV